MMNPQLGTLECKPIEGGVTCKAPATFNKTGLEAARRHIFHPNKR